ncbi:hypothetical protein BBOV_III004470 [Babesia bovis T2Bo]|uniref:Uncharacterized protein n=1 Tax=Babesia bovis TaxID=5865 RepID=A7AN76_BABBO|nr:hypothetical protein BBOV_III004470 [Babesia bovis T2Bo]EDO08010.1 hypothetical protein BBOV_III004470 [Babesia bovis T2Bo]|eukprot:XP_001611578.1 hypothetical protein [Babesia bovis T2Bo]
MVRFWCKCFIPICGIQLVVYMDVVYNVILELDDLHQPDYITVHHGSFMDKGRYRNFSSKIEYIDTILYKGRTVKIVPFIGKKLAAVFVQHYINDNVNIIVITKLLKCHTMGYRSSYKDLNTMSPYNTSRKTKQEVVGPVFLYLDANDENIHPLILTYFDNSQPTVRKWYILPQTRKKLSSDILHHLRRVHDTLYISPFVGIEPSSDEYETKLASIYSLADAIKWVPGSPEISITIISGKTEREHFITIPSIEGDLFKPKGIMPYAESAVRIMDFHTYSGGYTINIDVGSFEVNSRLMIIVANLKRGNWWYSQYCLANEAFSIYKKINVVDLQNDVAIYECVSGEVITHVEVFENRVDHNIFILLNIKKTTTSYTYVDIQKVYMKEITAGGVIYYDINLPGIEPFITMLHNINVEAPG